MVALGALLFGCSEHDPSPTAPPSQAPPSPVEPGTILLVDTSRVPSVQVEWTSEGRPERSRIERAIGSRADRTPVTTNLEAFVVIGGTRLDMGLADARGSTVSLGFYKLDNAMALFEGIDAGSSVTIEVSGVVFNQPVRVGRSGVLHHAKFEDPSSVIGCTVAPNELNLYNSSREGDDLEGRITEKTGRVGVLDQTQTRARVEADGSVTVIAVIPYELFQHADDRWKIARPGLFVEPYHFHIECEVLPAWAEELPLAQEPT